MNEENQKKGFFKGVSSKTTFVFGLVVGLALASTVGFITVLNNRSDQEKKVEPAVKGAEANSNTNSNEEVAAPIVTPQITDQDHIKGDSKAAVTLIEFTDLQCPYCSRFHSTVNQLLKDYSGQVKIVIKHFPLSMHNHSKDAAIAAECAGEQGKFWELVDAVFTNQSELQEGGTDFLKEQAKSIGLNEGNFYTCLTSGKFDQKISQQYSESLKAGAEGTPYSLLIKAGKDPLPISGAEQLETIKSMIDSLK